MYIIIKTGHNRAIAIANLPGNDAKHALNSIHTPAIIKPTTLAPAAHKNYPLI